MRISVVTFTTHEQAAVDALLRDLVNGQLSPWQWTGGPRGEVTIERQHGRDVWRLDHIPLGAQGNVVAAGELARLFQDRKGEDDPPGKVVFYGCAGAINPRDTGRVFLVGSVNYLSLGTVDPGTSGEAITLKNKWLCHTHPPAGVLPLPQITFPLLTGHGSVDIRTLTGFPTAQVAATDKVVRVAGGEAPIPVVSGPPQPAYAREEWSYGQALALVAGSGNTILVEMESYGIACVAQALSRLEDVVVMRITTDSLENHANSDDAQQELLMKGRRLLAHLLVRLFAPGLYSPCASTI